MWEDPYNNLIIKNLIIINNPIIINILTLYSHHSNVYLLSLSLLETLGTKNLCVQNGKGAVAPILHTFYAA